MLRCSMKGAFRARMISRLLRTWRQSIVKPGKTAAQIVGNIYGLQMNSRCILTASLASLDLAVQIFTPLLQAPIVDEDRMMARSLLG
jgi:hypothetical protein